ncbi:Holliday junction branch migration protein RuvA [Anaerobacillus sp. MEB173]|uniref:Holliday junction branch migration protein RuvA n=1 Tax=Anaerobacillus sp. MEB173 TaxID=3383345 RepID=UPI003F8E3F44
MIEFIVGKLEYIDPQSIVVENNGIGYQVFCPNPFAFQGEMDKIMKVFTYHYVREDIQRLYGFKTRNERALFEKLLNVSGIGPKGALAILASGQPEQVVSAIEEEDEKFLVKFPGVGKKTARQIILDLKGKLTDFLPTTLEMSGLFANQNNEVAEPQTNQALSEAIEALRTLGYVEKEIKKITPKLEDEKGLSTDQYIKKALQLLLNG